MKNKNIIRIAVVTALLLVVPLIAMQFTNEVTWSFFDFLVAGCLLFGTGLTYELISRKSVSITYKVAVGLGVMASLILIWANLAVGVIGSENNPVNLMYGAVFATGFIGAIIARLKPQGMSRTLFSMAVVQMLVPIVALTIFKREISSDEVMGVLGVLGINAFFAIMFVGSGLLFRQASNTGSKPTGQLVQQAG